jgi:alpha-beta hydrolase superfamily lysophospholipase
MSSASSPPEVRAEHREGRLDGRLYWQGWVPDSPRATVVLAHGSGEHSGRYRYLVERVVPAGFELYAIDHRGHGRSEGRRAYVDRMRHLVDDLDLLVDQVRGDRPLFLLGHSMGGCVALEYALRHQDKLDGLALSAPLAALEAAPLPLRLVAQALSIVAPWTPVFKIDVTAISRDPAEVRAYEQDELNFHGMLAARSVQEMADSVGRFPDEVSRLTLPILIMHGTADRLTPIAGAEMIAARAASDDLTFHRYDGFYHELFNEPPGERDRPLDDLVEWLSARV